jgi:hypothetical protein
LNETALPAAEPKNIFGTLYFLSIVYIRLPNAFSEVHFSPSSSLGFRGSS